ncbi:MAG: DUF4258 domain-containing protein [Planctomycetota bacterium]
MAELREVWWVEDDDCNAVAHIAEHGVTVEEVEAVLAKYFHERRLSRSGSGRWVTQGWTPSGRPLTVVFEFVEELGIALIITAFEHETEVK